MKSLLMLPLYARVGDLGEPSQNRSPAEVMRGAGETAMKLGLISVVVLAVLFLVGLVVFALMTRRMQIKEGIRPE